MHGVASPPRSTGAPRRGEIFNPTAVMAGVELLQIEAPRCLNEMNSAPPRPPRPHPPKGSPGRSLVSAHYHSSSKSSRRVKWVG